MDQVRAAVSAEAFTAVVEAYADRVHDDVRRVGCTPPEAVEVVEASAFRLLDRVRTTPQLVGDLVGAWFREARTLARRTAGAEATAAAASAAAPAPAPAPADGIVGASDEDALTREALALLAERDRTALLLRDSYDLPYSAVGVALGVEPALAPAVVALARLRFASALDGDPEPVMPQGHDRELGELAMHVDAAADKRVAAHAAKCTVCGPAEPAMRESRRLLRGLAIIAMPDDARDELIMRAARAASRELPTAEALAAAVAAAEDAAEERPWGVTGGMVALCLLAALLLGGVFGAVTGGDGQPRAFGPDGEEIEESESPSASPSASPSPSPSGGSPSPTATATARPTPTRSAPSATASPTPTATQSGRPPWNGLETLSLSPSEGRNCSQTVLVTGHNWFPGVRVRITYRDLVGRRLGGEVTALPDAGGTFRVRIVPCDSANIPGPHTVRAENGTQTQEAGYTSEV